MRVANTPRLDLRYWVTISLASVFGCNTGDVVSHMTGLGYTNGLPVLAALLAAILFAERRVRAPTELAYWLAIVVIRTAATNLADFATDEMEWGYGWVSGVLAALLALTVLAARLRRPKTPREVAVTRLPATDGLYWTGMLVAGTLGTVLGDEATYTFGISAACLGYGAVTGAAVALIRRGGYRPWLYWLTIVAIRAAGTDVADYLAFRRGIWLGLPVSTTLTGVLFFAAVLLWRPQRDAAMVPARGSVS